MRNSYNDAMSWIKNGDEDLHSAKILIDNNGSLRNIGFHCQQATEKYLKAFLEFNEIRFPRTHELSNLYSICFEIDSSIDIDLNFLSNFTEYAVDIRYSKNPDIDEKSLYTGYNYVQAIRSKILSKIKE
ncbi:MAG: HEPN domain-containing protein [Leptospiraceae bacterium]|nr:HEPN domain-containing protein [Leptospiraceae bacterium]